MVSLPYGRVSYALDLGDRPAALVEPPTPPPPRDLCTRLDEALDHPIGRPRLETLVGANARVTVIVSDATRAEPRSELVEAVRRRLPAVRWTIAIATGTHGPSGIVSLGLPSDLLGNAAIVDHDGHADHDMVTLGVTRRGTPARVHRCVVDADLVIATGCIRPHYFAGFGAGVKAIFPGLGSAREIRINHALKREAAARAGIVDENPCRRDLEEAVSMLPTPAFLLNGVCASDGRVYDAVAGDLLQAFRSGVELARPWFTVRARPAPIVIASDALPVSGSLYQAAKIAAAVAPLVLPNGRLVLVAECADGVGPLDTVNEAIFRIGVFPRLQPDVRISLVSSLPESTVRQTLLEYARSPADVLAETEGDIVVVPRASQLLIEPTL
jgi:nickel-dependent lactate racemase